MILDVEGQKLDDSNQLRMRISLTPPGTTVNMRVLHNGTAKTVAVKLAEMPGNLTKNGGSPQVDPEGGSTNALEGVSVEAAKSKGVLVTDVDQSSPPRRPACGRATSSSK